MPRPANEQQEIPTEDRDHLVAEYEERESIHRRQIRQLKRDLQNSQTELSKLRSNYLSKASRTSEMETFFVRCIDSVKRDIARRRKARKPTSIKSEFSEFTSADRVQVIERLLSHDEVLSLIYDHLFPQERVENEDKKTIPSLNATPLPQEQEQLERSSTTEPTSAVGKDTRGHDHDVVVPVGSGAAAAHQAKTIALDDSIQEYLRQG